MARVIKLKESDIGNIVKKILAEEKGARGIWPPAPDRPNVGMAGPPSGQGNPPPQYPDFPGAARGNSGGGIKVKNIDDVRRALGNPRTIEEVVINYEKLYNCQPTTEGMPTPDEIRIKMDEISGNPTGGDPVVSAMWILFGVFKRLLMILICIDWGGEGDPPPGYDSDITLKENIDLVGTSKSGINIYEFDYINKKYGNGRYPGVMAQEVPSASFIGPEGTLKVDYSKIDVQI